MNSKQLFEKAEVLRSEEKLDEAISAYMESSKAADQEKDRWIMAESIHMIGLIHLQKKELDMAEHCLDSALNLFKKQQDTDMVGSVLRDLAQVFVELGDLDTAEKHLKESIINLEKGEKLGHLGISKVKLGNLYDRKKEFDKAESLILEGIEDIKRSDDRFFESSAYFTLAKFYKNQDRKEDSKKSAEKSLAILNDLSPDGAYESRKEEISELIKGLDSN